MASVDISSSFFPPSLAAAASFSWTPCAAFESGNRL